MQTSISRASCYALDADTAEELFTKVDETGRVLTRSAASRACSQAGRASGRRWTRFRSDLGLKILRSHCRQQFFCPGSPGIVALHAGFVVLFAEPTLANLTDLLRYDLLHPVWRR